VSPCRLTITTALAMRHPTVLKDVISVGTSEYALKSRNVVVLPKVKTTKYGLSLPSNDGMHYIRNLGLY